MSDILGGGGADIATPGVNNAPLEEGAAASGAAMQNRYNQLGLGGSTMAQQDQSALGQDFATQEAIETNNQLQSNFSDQLALNSANNSSLSGLAGLAGFLG